MSRGLGKLDYVHKTYVKHLVHKGKAFVVHIVQRHYFNAQLVQSAVKRHHVRARGDDAYRVDIAV